MVLIAPNARVNAPRSLLGLKVDCGANSVAPHDDAWQRIGEACRFGTSGQSKEMGERE
jgi:hypothetical protein